MSPPLYDLTHEPFDFLANEFLLAGWPIMVAFVVFYAVRSPWRSTAVGRAMMYQAGSIILVYTLAAISVLFGRDWAGFGFLRLLVYATVTISHGRLLVVLLRIQGRPRIGPAAPPEDGRTISREEKAKGTPL